MGAIRSSRPTDSTADTLLYLAEVLPITESNRNSETLLLDACCGTLAFNESERDVLQPRLPGAAYTGDCTPTELGLENIPPLAACFERVDWQGSKATHLVEVISKTLTRSFRNMEHPARQAPTLMQEVFSSLSRVFALCGVPEAHLCQLSRAVRSLLTSCIDDAFLPQATVLATSLRLALLEGQEDLKIPLLPEDAAGLLELLHSSGFEGLDSADAFDNHAGIVLAAKLADLAVSGRSLGAPLAGQMKMIAVRKLQSAVQSILASVEYQLSEIDAVEENVKSLYIPPATYVRAVSSLAALTAVYEYEALAAIPATTQDFSQTRGSETLNNRRGLAANGMLQSNDKLQRRGDESAMQRTREASRAALKAASRRLRQAEEGLSQPLDSLPGVLDALLDVAEGCFAFCWEVGPGEEVSQQVLELTTVVLEQLGKPLSKLAESGAPGAGLDQLARVRAIMLSSALLARTDSSQEGSESKHAFRVRENKLSWSWDLRTSVAIGVKGSAEGVCRHSVEVLSFALACSWQQSSRLAVEAMLLPLADAAVPDASFSSAECQAILLSLGRLVAMVDADEGLLRLALPLVAESALPGAHSEVRACACHVLAGIAALSAKKRHKWAYEQAVEVLLKEYRIDGNCAASSLLYSSPRASCPGALANALHLVAQHLEPAPASFRSDFELKLLSLFSDVGLEARSEEQVQDLGCLLPAIADAWQDSQAASTRLRMSSCSMDFESLQRHQSADSKLVKLYRMLWIYVSVHELAREPSSKAQKRQRPAMWRQAAVRIAQGPTPLLVAGGEMDIDQVEAEFSERVRRLSKSMSPLKLATKLLDGIKSGQVPAAGLVASAGHPARNAHLLSTLVLNLLRVENTPGSASRVCPLAPLFATQQVASSKSWELPWLSAMTERVFNVYLDRLSSASSEQDEEATRVGQKQLALSQTLIQNLGNKGINKSTRDLAEKLLEKLLKRCTALVWQPQLLAVLLGLLDAKDASGYPVAVDSRVHSWLRKVVERGAAGAPGLMEALLHEQLRKEPDTNNAQSLQASQNLMVVLRQAKMKSRLGILEGSPSGVVALHKKAHFGGMLSGMVALANDRGEAHGSLLSLLIEQLEAVLVSGASQRDIHDRLLGGTAGLLMYAGITEQLDLLRLICWAPTFSLNPQSLRDAVFAWQWIAVCAPELQVSLLSELVSAWLATMADQKGIFSQSYDLHSLANATTNDIGPTDSLEDTSLKDTVCEVDAISAHHLWLMFFLEAWQVWGVGLGPISDAATCIFGRLVLQSVHSDVRLTHHPAAAGAIFRLLLLAIRYARHKEATSEGVRSTSIIFQRILHASLEWFNSKPAYFGKWSPAESREELAAVSDFFDELETWDDWVTTGGRSPGNTGGASADYGEASAAQDLQLLKMLLKSEIKRLQVWVDPLGVANRPTSKSHSSSQWQTYAIIAWNCNPHLAINLIDRFPKAMSFTDEISRMVVSNVSAWEVRTSPNAAELLAGSSDDSAVLARLVGWAPAGLLQALRIMSGSRGTHPNVRAYALQSLHTCPIEQVAFFLPQLVQLLRSDDNGMIKTFLLDRARHSLTFAHHLVCTLRSEGTPPQEAFNPVVKRSGWHPPQDSGLWKIADALEKQVWEVMSQEAEGQLRAELEFFDRVTAVSGKLYPVPKDERKAAAVRLVNEIELPRSDLYLPTNTGSRVIAAIPESATPMQSAAKVPILVAFKVEDQNEDRTERVQACIFKVGDDCRQDVLALQVIGLLKDAFQRAGLGLYVAPYGVLPTAYECGIVEVVPDSKSRSALGETSDGGLLEIWSREFGAPGTERFEEARRNFIVSEAGYAIACYLLQAKDRHNGNILVDALGHLVHIDFGFILEISPGGNLGFESAAFKLSHEMTQLLDPSGNRTSPQFRLFQELCIRGYLAARTVAEGVIATVQLMSASGLPCYSRGAPLANLQKRFHLEMSDAQAAAFMRSTIADAYDKWTTGFYDFVQYLQNSIPK